MTTIFDAAPLFSNTFSRVHGWVPRILASKRGWLPWIAYGSPGAMGAPMRDFLGGGNSNIFFFHPKTWWEMIFSNLTETCAYLFRWVLQKKPPAIDYYECRIVTINRYSPEI